MTDERLRELCRELERLREHLAKLRADEDVIEADLIAAMTAANHTFLDYRPGRRANLERPVTRSVDEGAFLAAARELECDEAEILDCITRKVAVMKARRLIGDPLLFDRLCTLHKAGPMIRLVSNAG